MKCFWKIGHDWTTWHYWYDYRRRWCRKCGDQQKRWVML